MTWMNISVSSIFNLQMDKRAKVGNIILKLTAESILSIT